MVMVVGRETMDTELNLYIYNLGVIHHSQDYSFMLMQTARSLDDSVGITLPSVKFYSG